MEEAVKKKKKSECKRGRKLEVKIKQRQKRETMRNKKEEKSERKERVLCEVNFPSESTSVFLFFVFLLKPQLQILFVRRN
jgi:hypothetical protein